MRRLTTSTLALLMFTAAMPQQAPGDSWGDLMLASALPQKWPSNLEGIHACHIPRRGLTCCSWSIPPESLRTPGTSSSAKFRNLRGLPRKMRQVPSNWRKEKCY
jgi:hypothetical protein